MDNIEELLKALAEDDETNDSPSETEQQDNGGGLFDGLDIETLMKMMTLFEQAKRPTDNERFLLALKPLLREENRSKVDVALKFMKIFALLPVLKESGMLGKLL